MTGADLLPSLEALHQALLAHDSATAVLETTYGGPVHIRRLAAGDAGPAPEARAILHAPWPEPVLHRRVNLLRATLVLSEADLWYVPARLPPEMAATLLATNTPFGRVVAPLHPRRATLAAAIHPAGEIALEHRAVLRLPDGRALAFVHERYPREPFHAAFATP